MTESISLEQPSLQYSYFKCNEIDIERIKENIKVSKGTKARNNIIQ